MAINTLSAPPISTQLIQTLGQQAQKNVVPSVDDPALVTPEDVNTRVDTGVDRANQLQQTQAEAQAAKRGAAVSISNRQNQQEAAELFIEISTGEEIDSRSGGFGLDNLQGLTQTLRVNQLANAIDNSDFSRDDVTGPDREQLEERFEKIIRPDDPPPTIDVTV